MSKPRSSSPPRFALAIRKFMLSFFVVITFIAYAIRNHMDLSDAKATDVPTSSSQLAKGGDSLVLSKSTAVPTNVPQPTASTILSAVPAMATALPTQIPLIVPTDIPTDVPPPTATPAGQYKDGTYDGPVVDAYYGNVQVEAIVRGGQITDVRFLDYPQDRRTSRFINQQAMPWLTQEAIQVQSANVDLISGATFTSQAFAMSLQSALQQAQNHV